MLIIKKNNKGETMKIFLSWSGEQSHKVAVIFRDWFPSVIQSLDPYVSSEDIDKGARWTADIAKELENSTFGILCVTKENINAPWLIFEAGALSKTVKKSFVSPFLFNIKRSEVDGPILQFQSTVFEKEDIKKLLKTINKACGEEKLNDTQLAKTFDVWYPTLETDLNKIQVETVKEQKDKAPNNEILEEILELSRLNQKLLRTPDTSYRNEHAQVNHRLTEIRDRLAPFGKGKLDYIIDLLTKPGVILKPMEKAFEDLSTQELKVLLLITQGKTNREIAEALFLGEGTVRNYVSSILHKLGVSNRAEAAAYAIQNGLEDQIQNNLEEQIEEQIE